MTPTARTLAWLRKTPEWHPAVVEKWNAHARIRQDLFGFIDIVCLRPGMKILGIQATSASNVAARVSKIIESPLCRPWLLQGDLWVVGWSKKGPRGKMKRWSRTLRIMALVNGEVVVGTEIADA